MRLVFIGAPGSGKGTQAAILSRSYAIPQISTGDMLRSAVEKGSQLGQQVEKYMKAGLLVADETIFDLVKERIQRQDAVNGFILDGFPRNVGQADMLSKILVDHKQQLDIVFYLDVPQVELMERLLGRSQEENRSDDNQKTIEVRLATYEKETRPLLNYYQNIGILHSIDGTGSLAQVSERLEDLIASIS